MDMKKLAKTIALVQAGHYIISGLWPVVHLKSFERVTTPKKDKWLEKSCGLFIALTGMYFLLAGVSKPTWRTKAFGMIFPAGLATADLCWGWRKTKSPAYLADAGLALLAVGGWLSVCLKNPKSNPFKHPIRLAKQIKG